MRARSMSITVEPDDLPARAYWWDTVGMLSLRLLLLDEVRAGGHGEQVRESRYAFCLLFLTA